MVFKRFYLLLAAVLMIASPAFAGRSDFEKYSSTNGLTLPHTLLYKDFQTRAYDMGILDVESFLEKNEIIINGTEDSRYLLGRDLMKACGETCSTLEGLGTLLVKFLKVKQHNK